MNIEFIHGQRIKLDDQGFVVEIEAEVSDINKIVKQVQSNGIFTLPKGKVELRGDLIYIGGGKYIIETDPNTRRRMLSEGANFRLPPNRTINQCVNCGGYDYVPLPEPVVANQCECPYGRETPLLPIDPLPMPVMNFVNEAQQVERVTDDNEPLLPPSTQF